MASLIALLDGVQEMAAILTGAR